MKASSLFSLLSWAALSGLPVDAVQAQGHPKAGGPGLQMDSGQCQSQVLKFEQSIGVVRQSQGAQVAAELKERLLPSKLEMEILFKDGYCGLVHYLRGKKLID